MGVRHRQAMCSPENAPARFGPVEADTAHAGGRMLFPAGTGGRYNHSVRFSSMSMFDRWAPGYDDSALQTVYECAHRTVLGWAAGLGVRPRRILDLGCGTGRLLALAAGTFPEATLAGVDASAGMLTVAAARVGPATQLVQAS